MLRVAKSRCMLPAAGHIFKHEKLPRGVNMLDGLLTKDCADLMLSDQMRSSFCELEYSGMQATPRLSE